jgi:hypothetical protein
VQKLSGMFIYEASLRKDLDGNFAVEVLVPGVVHLSHSASTDLLDDAIMRDGLPD